MADSRKSAVEFLEELRKERDELNGLIKALEKRLGSPAAGPVGFDDDEEAVAEIPTEAPIPIGFFHNLSQAAAAEKLLKMNKDQPLSTARILEAFKNSGMQLNPKNSVQILYTALKRSPKFERVGKVWGLKEWYPEKRRKKDDKEEEEDSSSHM